MALFQKVEQGSLLRTAEGGRLSRHNEPSDNFCKDRGATEICAEANGINRSLFVLRDREADGGVTGLLGPAAGTMAGRWTDDLDVDVVRCG